VLSSSFHPCGEDKSTGDSFAVGVRSPFRLHKFHAMRGRKQKKAGTQTWVPAWLFQYRFKLNVALQLVGSGSSVGRISNPSVTSDFQISRSVETAAACQPSRFGAIDGRKQKKAGTQTWVPAWLFQYRFKMSIGNDPHLVRHLLRTISLTHRF
jgi:hypothetical protein